jgi:hypothetical protein
MSHRQFLQADGLGLMNPSVELAMDQRMRKKQENCTDNRQATVDCFVQPAMEVRTPYNRQYNRMITFRIQDFKDLPAHYKNVPFVIPRT